MTDPTAPERFDRTAGNYAVSPHHAAGRSLDRLVEMAGPLPGARLLDVACGSGHASIALAARGARVVALDPAPRMLAEVARFALARGLSVARCRGLAEALPFADGSFQVVTSRIAPHHFADLALALQEAARVVRPGGTVAVSDLCGHRDPEVDAFSHRLEVLHDPTHMRSHTLARWRALFERAGLQVESAEEFSEPEEGLLLSAWCRVAQTPEENRLEIARLCRRAPEPVRRALGIEDEGADLRLRQRRIALLAGRR